MKLTDISIRRSGVMAAWIMEITILTPAGEMKTTQHFDDFGGFLTAVKEAGTFFAVRLGRIKSTDANSRLLTRPLAENPDGLIR
jgi:hypothetical protein